MAVWEGAGNMAAHRDKDVVVLLSVPQMDLGSDILKRESPWVGVQAGFVVGTGNPRPKRFTNGVDDALQELRVFKSQLLVRPFE